MKRNKIWQLGIAAALILGLSAGATVLVSCRTTATLHGNERVATSPSHAAYLAKASGSTSDGSERPVVMELQMYSGSSWQTLESVTMPVGAAASTAEWGRAEMDQSYTMRIRLTPYDPPVFRNPCAIGYGWLYVDPDSAE